MTPASLLLRAALALSLLASVPAAADPPEGCIGFPDIPEAFLCITQWSPENAVPTPSVGPNQTYTTIPEFCVFQCFGPTPVNAPSIVIQQGDGVIARIVYNGQTYTVAVPSGGDPNALIQQVVTTVTGLVDTVLGIVNGAVTTVTDIVNGFEPPQAPGTFTASVHVNCYGCDIPSPGNLSGSFSGVLNGHVYNNAPMYTSSFTHGSGSGTSCLLAASGSGYITIGSDSASFLWTQSGQAIILTFGGDFNGSGYAVQYWPGATCGAPADFTIIGTIAA